MNGNNRKHGQSNAYTVVLKVTVINKKKSWLDHEESNCFVLSWPKEMAVIRLDNKVTGRKIHEQITCNDCQSHEDTIVWRFIASGTFENHRLRLQSRTNTTTDPRHVRREWWIVKTPVQQVVLRAVAIPIFQWQRGCNLHPMTLRFKVTVHGWCLFTRVRPQTNQMSIENHRKEKKNPTPWLHLICLEIDANPAKW